MECHDRSCHICPFFRLSDVLEARDPVWKTEGKAFLESVNILLERLLQYRDALQKNHQISCIANLLELYEVDPARRELYLRYVYKLHDLHLNAENYVEAGFTLLRHAELLDWTSLRTLHADLRYSSQKEWERKEQLYLNVVDLFERGKHWEGALPLCKELAKVYEENVFEYKKLSSILRRQAGLVDKIAGLDKTGEIRLEPEYFKVSFSLKGPFPVYLRGKSFVYRGMELEKLPAFVQRIQEEFPEAKLLQHQLQAHDNDNDDDEEEEEEGIRVCCVKPVFEAAAPVTDLPEKIRQSRQRLKISTFRYDRPYHRGGEKDPDNEFKSLCLERTTMSTKCPFPGILRWIEVKDSRVEHVQPVIAACETVEAKNEELRKMICKEPPFDQSFVQKLSLCLQGAIDAAVNGGVAKYQEAFFEDVDLEADEKSRLQRAMTEQVDALGKALGLHERIISFDMRPLHEHLVSRWRNMRGKMDFGTSSSPSPHNVSLTMPGGRKQGPLPPVPVVPSSPPIYSRPLADAPKLMTVSMNTLPAPRRAVNENGGDGAGGIPPLPPRHSNRVNIIPCLRTLNYVQTLLIANYCYAEPRNFHNPAATVCIGLIILYVVAILSDQIGGL